MKMADKMLKLQKNIGNSELFKVAVKKKGCIVIYFPNFSTEE